MICRLVCPNFSYCDGQKIRAYALLSQKPLLQPVFDTKHPKNHDKLIHGLKKQKKTPKTELNSKLKINQSSDLFFHELLRYQNT